MHETGLEVGSLYTRTHLYQNHVEQMQEQLSREVRSFPTLVLNPDKASVFDFDMEDIKEKAMTHIQRLKRRLPYKGERS